MTLVTAWVIYAIFGIIGYSAAFVWAVRTRQFSDTDRARYIALDGGKAVEPDSEPEQSVSRIDRYTWIGLALLTLAMIAWTIAVGKVR